ncbi:hypothetical protein GCM10010174_87050 [Kutzneria viridogrisea]
MPIGRIQFGVAAGGRAITTVPPRTGVPPVLPSRVTGAMPEQAASSEQKNNAAADLQRRIASPPLQVTPCPRTLVRVRTKSRFLSGSGHAKYPILLL